MSQQNINADREKETAEARAELLRPTRRRKT
jgi:hypothetical protein